MQPFMHEMGVPLALNIPEDEAISEALAGAADACAVQGTVMDETSVTTEIIRTEFAALAGEYIVRVRGYRRPA